MEDRNINGQAHTVKIEERRRLTMSGVEDVERFDEDKVIAYTTEGIMTIKGADFRINRLNVDNGELEIEGEIDSIEYADGHKAEKGSFLGRIFK